MNNSLAVFNLKKLKDYADWKLLLLLLLVLNIKLPVKIAAITIIYLLQWDFKFGFKFGFKLKASRLPLFYPLIILIAFAALVINKDYQNHNYLIVFLAGICFWVISILITHQIKLMVDKTDTETIYRTIVVFFIINAIVSIGHLAFIMWKTGSINPYTFRGMNQMYFINTGDDIKGITFDISSTNAVLCAFGVFYFLFKKSLPMVIICMGTLLLTYSNFITLVMLFTMVLLFIFKSTRDQKSMIAACFLLYAVFMAKISPQNMSYMDEALESSFHHKNNPIINSPITAIVPITKRPDSVLTFEEKRQKIATLYLDSIGAYIKPRPRPSYFYGKNLHLNNQGRIYIPEPDNNSPEFYISPEITPDRKQLLDFISLHKASLPISTQKIYAPSLPGKLSGMIQTLNFFKQHPEKIIAGLGIGNFSSKIAFRAAGAGIRGDYPQKFIYINKAFLANHLDLYLSFFSREAGFRSVKNNPFSVYDQLFSEYGLLGLAAFFFCYLGFFVRHIKTLTYGLPILFFTIAILFVDYWFEQLSVMIVFELLLFLNIKETAVNYAK